MSQFPLAIPPEVSAACDAHHVAKLYCVCRFCYGRIPPTAGKARTSPRGKTTCERAVEFYDIDFISELANLRVPKVLCPSCQVRLSGLALGKLDVNEWREQKRFFVQAPVNTSDPLRTRSKDICSVSIPTRANSTASHPYDDSSSSSSSSGGVELADPLDRSGVRMREFVDCRGLPMRQPCTEKNNCPWLRTGDVLKQAIAICEAFDISEEKLKEYVAEVQNEYGRKKLSGATNILSINGGADPWISASITEDQVGVRALVVLLLSGASSRWQS
ncbi:hypothetical protein FOL47_006959 [Perkinsus chesapeaki]|uniref:Uncharacterized protein n=1 Tax=Perkinsus chesapeaki TaxID=330153 RepID=A0A7J6N3H8_PERCH|nr:hypothetical protein FOL47_006959 [Perkinsus chesapeaki]